MKNIKTFESFAEELFGFPVLSEFSDRDSEIFFELTDPIFKEANVNLFDEEEPSSKFGKFAEPEDIQVSFWLNINSIKLLRLFSPSIIRDLESAFPNRKREYTYKGPDGTEKKRESYSSVDFGIFFWYSTKDGMSRIWLLGKDSSEKYRVAHGREKDLSAAWESSKVYETIEDAISDQSSTLKDISKHFERHIDMERRELEIDIAIARKEYFDERV